MSVNAPNIFEDLFLVSPDGPDSKLPACRNASLIIGMGLNWATAAAASHFSLVRQSRPQQILFLRIEGIPHEAETCLTLYMRTGVSGIVLSGCTGAAHLQHLATVLRVAEAQAELPDGSTTIAAEFGGAADAFLPARPIPSNRLGAVIFNEEAACQLIGSGGAAISAMRASTQLMAAQAGVPCYLLGDGSMEGFSGRILRKGLT